ncbi:FCS-Like Zinc finger 2-like [Lotus japonicus]|uniref:FLZ-type domain-containing protein n=1 Tax=Lotus japonicus TaxID=34305 RepID=I3T8J9_LOTJA|nr:FCS-Like Zinc finger 2-like [Lotus japonicus]AFK48841.1 unknown [Lotus japonicus]
MHSPVRPCYLEKDHGLASLPDMDSGYRVNSTSFVSRSSMTSGYGYATSCNRGSFRNLSVSSPRSGRFYDSRFEDHQPHFLEACFLCKKSLGDNRDIFMYRGDTPFCSEECRQEQIEIDEAKEKNMKASSMKALRSKEQRNSASPNKARDYSFRATGVAA